MSNLNSVCLEGHLTRNAELSYFDNQSPVCNFAIACNDSYKGADGNYVDIVSYFDCQLKGKYGEAMAKHLVKGRGVRIEGRLKQNRWEKDGQKFSRVFVRVRELYLSPLPNGERQEYQPSVSYQQPDNFQSKQPPSQSFAESFDADPQFDIPDMDIPF